jgi:hypothetical protein
LAARGSNALFLAPAAATALIRFGRYAKIQFRQMLNEERDYKRPSLNTSATLHKLIGSSASLIQRRREFASVIVCRTAQAVVPQALPR